MQLIVGEHLELREGLDLKAEAEFYAAVSKAAGRSAGTVQSLNADGTASVWVYDVIKVKSRGRRIGNIDRTTPTVLINIDIQRFASDWEYRRRVGNRMALGMGEGLSIGDAKIQYSGGSSTVEWLGSGSKKSLGAAPDSFAQPTDGNFAEDFQGGKNYGDWETQKASHFKPLTFKLLDAHENPDKEAEPDADKKSRSIHVTIDPFKQTFGTRKPRVRKARLDYLEKLARKRKRENRKLEKAAKRYFKPCQCDGCENGARGKYCSDRCSTIARSRRYRTASRFTSFPAPVSSIV